MEFKEPSDLKSGHRNKHKYQDIADELKSHPGKWAIAFRDKPTSLASNINGGKLVNFAPRGYFQATCRGINTKTRIAEEIYVRYIGPIEIGDN